MEKLKDLEREYYEKLKKKGWLGCDIYTPLIEGTADYLFRGKTLRQTIDSYKEREWNKSSEMPPGEFIIRLIMCCPSNILYKLDPTEEKKLFKRCGDKHPDWVEKLFEGCLGKDFIDKPLYTDIERKANIRKANRLKEELIIERFKQGNYNYEDICHKKDAHSILRKNGYKIVKQGNKNLEKEHIEWGLVSDLFEKYEKEPNWNFARLNREMCHRLHKEMGRATMFYKLKELGIKRKKVEEEELLYFIRMDKDYSELGKSRCFDKYGLKELKGLEESYMFSLAELSIIFQIPMGEILNSLPRFPKSEKSIPYFSSAVSNLEARIYKIDLKGFLEDYKYMGDSYMCEKYEVTRGNLWIYAKKLKATKEHPLENLKEEMKSFCEETLPSVDYFVSKYSYGYTELKIEIEKYYRKTIGKLTAPQKIDYVEERRKVRRVEIEPFVDKIVNMFLLGYTWNEIEGTIGSKVHKSMRAELGCTQERLEEHVNSVNKEGKQVCFRCHSIRTLDHFHKLKDGKYRTQCKDCRRANKLKEVTSEELKCMYGYFDYSCAYCGRELNGNTLAIDHVHPRTKGGGNEVSNLVISCSRCNSVWKSDRSLDELVVEGDFTKERKEKIQSWISRS